MCSELLALVIKVSKIFPEIEEARPRCSSGIGALCLLNNGIVKARSLLLQCSESSILYLVGILHVSSTQLYVDCNRIITTLWCGMYNSMRIAFPMIELLYVLTKSSLKNFRHLLEMPYYPDAERQRIYWIRVSAKLRVWSHCCWLRR